MRAFEIQPTSENVLTTFEKDILGRNIDVFRFVKLLNSLDSSCAIALDARWGAGKTFFVKQVKMVLDAFNVHIKTPYSIDNERVFEAWNHIHGAKEVDLQPQISVYYDAWANDNDDDPVLSLVYSIMQGVSTDFSFKEKPAFLDVVAGIAEVLSGHSATALLETLKSDDPLVKIRSAKNLQDQVAEFLESLLAERGNRLVVIIDELDRCNPKFAIRLLERIKHYFNNTRVTFVFALNMAELQHSIRHYYGNGFDSTRYLERFFDLRIDLPPAKMNQFYQEIDLSDGYYIYEDVCRTVINLNHFTLREIAKFYRMAKTVAYQPTHDSEHSNFAFSVGKGTEFCLLFIVPMVLGLKMSDYNRYENFVSGCDSSPLHELFRSFEDSADLCRNLLDVNETYEESTSGEGIKLVRLEDKLNTLYHAIFIKQYSGQNYSTEIGKISIRRDSKDMILRTISALSDFADYEV